MTWPRGWGIIYLACGSTPVWVHMVEQRTREPQVGERKRERERGGGGEGKREAPGLLQAMVFSVLSVSPAQRKGTIFFILYG